MELETETPGLDSRIRLRYAGTVRTPPCFCVA
jgi:hypothetical protein